MTDNKNTPAGYDAFDDQQPSVKPMKRHAKDLQRKAKAHTVLPLDPAAHTYTVVSGGSGSRYTIIMFDDLTGNCDCDWAKKRPLTVAENKGAVGCSHVLAVIGYIAAASGKRVSTWADVDEAKRQHKKQVSTADGLVVTERSGAGRRVQATFFGLIDGQKR